MPGAIQFFAPTLLLAPGHDPSGFPESPQGEVLAGRLLPMGQLAGSRRRPKEPQEARTGWLLAFSPARLGPVEPWAPAFGLHPRLVSGRAFGA